MSYPSHFVGWYMVCPMSRNCTRIAHGASLFIRCYAIDPANKGHGWQRREGLFRGLPALYGPWWRGMEGSGAKGRGGWGRGAGRQGRGGTPWCTWGTGEEMMGGRAGSGHACSEAARPEGHTDAGTHTVAPPHRSTPHLPAGDHTVILWNTRSRKFSRKSKRENALSLPCPAINALFVSQNIGRFRYSMISRYPCQNPDFT